ncbi:unnamed protein product [Parajaminaea phylloscopi]
MAKDKKSRQHAAPTTDARFAKLHTDPRFLRPQHEDNKVVVDDRFKAMLDGGADFGVHKRNTKVDRFGRKQKKGSAATKEMQRLYRLGDDEAQTAEDADEASDASAADDSEGEGSSTKPFVDYARGAADLESSGDEDEDSENEESFSSSSSSSGDSDREEVHIGRSAVLRKERRRRAARGSSEESSEGGEDVDVDEGAEREIDSKALAALDAQAARVIAAGDDEADLDDQARAGSSSQTAAKARKAKGRKQATVPLGQETRRLAVVNMDWDHVRALDLYKVFSSLVSPVSTRLPSALNEFDEEDAAGGAAGGRRGKGSSALPVQGTVETVRVYPSDFGRERMKREDIEGPPKDIFKSAEDERSGLSRKKSKGKKKSRRGHEDSDDDEENALFQEDDGADFNEEALRKYQLERLRYYYAIATFDSPLSARHVYNAVDGAEMERTANIFDLQFVPDDMQFSDHQGGDDGWRDEAKPGVDDGVNYKGADWATDALRHSKVKLTWDAPDPDRLKVTKRRGLTKDELRDEDFRAYLATDSEGSDDEAGGRSGGPANGGDQASRDRFRALMGLDGSESSGKKKSRSAFEDARPSDDEDDGSDRDGDMEITFMPGLSEAAARKAAGQSQKQDGEETTLEKYLRKQREKKERRKAAKAGGADDGQEQGEQEPLSTKHAAKSAVSGDLGFEDPFFASDGDEDEPDLDAMLAEERAQEQSSKGAKPNGSAGKSAAPSEVPDDLAADDSDDGRKHFSLQDVLKAEKGGKKLNRWEKKKLAKQAKRQQQQEGGGASAGAAEPQQQDKLQAQPGFEIDVADPRFSGALMKDHDFALDPTHPSFTATEGMKKLLKEKRRRNDELDSSRDDLEQERRLQAAAAQQAKKQSKNKGAAGGVSGSKGSEAISSSNGRGQSTSSDDPAALLKSLKQRHQAKQQQDKSQKGGAAFGNKKRKVTPA